MANTLTGMSTTYLGKDIASLTEELKNLQALRPRINDFQAFLTVFRDVPEGVTTINVAVPVPITGSQDLSSGPVFYDVTSTGVSVTINRDTGLLAKYNPNEVQSYTLEQLASFLDQQIYGVERTFFSASLAQGLTNLHSTSSYRVTSDAAFTSSAVPGIAADLANSNITPEFVMVNEAKVWKLVDDLSNKGNSAGAQAILTGAPNNPYNVPILPSNLIPSLTGSAGVGTGNVVGISGQKGHVILATALPNVKHANGESFPFKSPRSGVTFLIENYYDESRRGWVMGPTCLWTVANGVASWKAITDRP